MGGQGGLVAALDLDRDVVLEQQLAKRLPVGARKREMAADALAGRNRRQEAHPVEAVVDRHSRGLGDQHYVGRHPAEQRKRQETVRDGSAERGLSRELRIDMDELAVLGCLGELADAVLGD